MYFLPPLSAADFQATTLVWEKLRCTAQGDIADNHKGSFTVQFHLLCSVSNTVT